MRWLVIALLMLFQMPPAMAGGADGAMACHGMPAGDMPAGDMGADHRPAGHHDAGAVHVCPGCALPAIAQTGDLLPRLPHRLSPPALRADLASLTAPPSVPPPRMA